MMVHRLRSALAVLVLIPLCATALAASRDFDIAAAPANQGVTQFAQQAGLPVLFPYELLNGRRTQALHGHYEIEAGLRQLLTGSGLVAYLNDRGQIAIRPAEERQRDARADDNAAAARPTLRPLNPGDDLPEVSVTASRVARDGMATPTPVTMLSRDELDALAPTTLVDALMQLPLFLNSDTPQSQSFATSGAAGASYLNLRGAGSNRSLMLLDGRRVVPSTRLGTVDLALFPQNLVQRIEVVTGGASASYGSDAVSGVVNVILDTDFQGLRGDMQAGISDRGDYGNLGASVTWGTRLGEASSLLLAGEVFSAAGIRGYASRDWFDSTAAIANPDPNGPHEIVAHDVHATGFTYGGLITGGPLAGTQFLAGGVPAPFEQGALYTGTTQSGGSGVDPAADLVWIQPDQQRLSAFARLHTQPTANLSAYAQLLAGRTENRFQKDQPSLWGPYQVTIYADNAFLPATIRGQMQAQGIDSFPMGRVAADGELGRAWASLTEDLASLTLGSDWHFSDWSLGGYYQYGRNRATLRYDDALRLDRIYKAVDSVVDPDSGQIVCRSTLSFPDDGCVPVNLFGPGSVSPAARAWVTEGSTAQIQDVREQVAELTLTGDLPFHGSAPLGIAAGLSWREESVAARAPRFPASLDELIVEPADTQGYRGLPAVYSGAANIFPTTLRVTMHDSYDVAEAFGELAVPLLRDAPLARHLDLHAALREAHYSGSGAIPAWKLGLDWQPFDSLRLRATRSRDVRAGNLSERYDVSRSGTTVVDRVQPGDPVYAVTGVRLGNPAIEPERSDTSTVGFVLQPAGVPGLSLSTDYYDIRIGNAIALYGVQNIVDGCAAGNLELCGLIERNTATGLITTVNNLVLNIAGARSRGIDLELAWRRPVHWFGGGESVALRLFANRTLESSTTDAQGNRTDRAGQTGLFGGAPRLQANLSAGYKRGPLQFTLLERYISSGSYNATYGPADIDDRHVRAAAYTTLNLNWAVPGARGTRLFFNVQNLFDQDPPSAGDWGFGGSIPTNEGLFDVLGRRYVLGLRFEQ